MKNFFKAYWKTLLFFSIVGLVGGFFVALYQFDSFPSEMQQQVFDEGLTRITLGLVSAVQSAGYGLVFGAMGIFLGKRMGLWRDERSITKKPLLVALVIAIIGGLSLILPDILFFGNYSDAIMDMYAVKPTVPYLIATVTYGAIIEEVLLRLFMMSLVAFILHFLFERKKEKPTTAVFVAANVISAILFAAGHLPATFTMIGSSPMIIFRCFLLNGTFGLLFGYLYRKYGLRYAMIAHGGCHVVSKLIWILFI